LQIKTKVVRCHTADSKPVKQEVNGTLILPPLVFPGLVVISMASLALFWLSSFVASHHFAVAPQSDAKDQFYSTVYT
jgi:hypothetical protein